MHRGMVELTGEVILVGSKRGLRAVAVTPEGKRVFLPGNALRKWVNGSVTPFSSLGEREVPAEGSTIVAHAYPCTKDTDGCVFLAAHWAKAEH